MSDSGPLDISSTPVDDAPPDDPSRIAAEVGLLDDIEEAKAADSSVEELG
jgi:hypothetical protein